MLPAGGQERRRAQLVDWWVLAAVLGALAVLLASNLAR